MTDLLQLIQKLQFTNRGEAEALLLNFVSQAFPSLQARSLELRPQAISLNSFNGYLYLAAGQKLFFKTHTEEDNQLDEYYNAKLLSEAGYPVIQPLYSSTEAGQHLLIYEAIDDPSVFDVAWTIEHEGDDTLFAALELAQQRADKHLFELYSSTLLPIYASENRAAPIHQLFYHRLVGGRMTRFYGDFISGSSRVVVNLPDQDVTMNQFSSLKWVINGKRYDVDIKSITEQAIRFLNPDRADISIVGHGDAHNGNVFLRENNLLYFDPAFAGRHNPLLDLVKPIFHNIFAMWMYYPHVKQENTPISAYVDGDTLHVNYQYALPKLRHMFLQSKFEYVLYPLLKRLQTSNQLRIDWRAYLKAGLFCCPFLTLNLCDNERFPPEITLLGFAMAVEMGAESHDKRSLIDAALDAREKRLAD